MKDEKRSHIIIVQHQNSKEGSNFHKLVDFINYHRMEYAISAKNYTPIKVQECYLDDHFEHGIQEYNHNVAFKFD